jgi:hypothetical protein
MESKRCRRPPPVDAISQIAVTRLRAFMAQQAETAYNCGVESTAIDS